MNRALLAGWMTLLSAGATGCIRVDGLPSWTAQDDPQSEEPSHGGARLTAACKDGEVPRERAAACLILAGYFQRGVFGFQRDPARAALLWESAVDMLQASCDHGEVADCTRAAAAIGMQLRPDAESAGWMVRYAEDGCRGGDVSGCALLGLIYERARGVARDEERSTAYYDQACGGGHQQSCLLLASRAEGREAVRDYERACSAGSGFGCAAAGQHHRKGVGVEPSTEKAGAFFTRGCEIGNLAACLLGAEMYATGPSPDRRRAMRMAGAACMEGIPDGCLLIGDLMEREQRPSSAREAYRRACKLGELKGCEAARAPKSAREDVESDAED
jgi:TPR repeat protein